MKILPRIRMLPLAALVLLAAGCSDVTDTSGSDVVALDIEDQAGNVLVTVNPVDVVTGSITLPRNSSRTLNIQFRSTAGYVQPQQGQTVRVTITNTQLATWDGTLDAGILTAGGTAGGTTMRIDLISGGLSVYTSPAIPVTIT